MKKTVRINISGVIFSIDEDAYLLLNKYLNSIEKVYSKSNEGKEILEDIEIRIAELFGEKISKTKQVITIADVSCVIEQLGQAEQFEEQTIKTNKQIKQNSLIKRLYRNPDDRLLGGICGGLGAYFNIDPVIVRIIFAVSIIFMGFGTLLYILLWIIIPEAKTTSQKLEMKGEAITISNIENAIREEFETVTSNLGFKKKQNMNKK